MSPLPRAALATAALLLLAGPAAAEDPPAPPPATAPSPPPPASPPPAPAVARPPARPRALPAARPRRSPPPRSKRAPAEVLPPEGTPIASFPGFSRLDDGKTRVFVEVSRKVEVAETRLAGRIVYRLRGAAVLQRTNRMALPTEFFQTPVERVQLVPMGPDLDVVIELREASTPVFQVTETPRGMVLWVDFPRSAGFAKDEEGPHSAGRVKGARTIGAPPQSDAPPPMDEP